MDAEQLIGSLIRGALTGRSRRKSGRRALRFLTGGRNSFLNASTLLTVAGVAWGIYESATEKPAAASHSAGDAGVPPIPGTTLPPSPLPAASDSGTPSSQSGEIPAELLRLIRLTISAARADGNMSREEMDQILKHVREAGAEKVIREELQNPRPLAEIISGVTDPTVKADIYTLAFAIVRADQGVSGAERIYLAQLANYLGLDTETTSRLEEAAAARIESPARE